MLAFDVVFMTLKALFLFVISTNFMLNTFLMAYRLMVSYIYLNLVQLVN